MKIGFSISVACLFLICGVSFTTDAQQINLPRKSPKASVSYQIGLTDVSIHFSSPALNDRNVWGDLVPFGEVWRAGANEATTIKFSTDVNMEGEHLPAGKYALFLIPRPGSARWTAIFNSRHDQWGAFNYDANHDVLRIDIDPVYNNPVQERLTYSIHDHDSDKGYVRFAWDDVRLYLRFKVDVLAAAMSNILDAIDEAPEDRRWLVYAQGANFLLETGQNLRQALQWADMSTARRSSSWNWWVKAQLQAKSGDLTSAISSAERSIQLGESAEGTDGFYNRTKEEIESKLTLWRQQLVGQ